MTREEKNNQLPPIVKQYIDKLTEPGYNRFQRDTACLILENIRDSCAKAIIEFKASQSNRKV